MGMLLPTGGAFFISLFRLDLDSSELQQAPSICVMTWDCGEEAQPAETHDPKLVRPGDCSNFQHVLCINT